MPNPERAWRSLRLKLGDDAQIEHLDGVESGPPADDLRGGSDRDRAVLREFSEQLELLRETYGHYRHEKLLRHCVRISEHAPVDIADTLDDKSAAEKVIRWIHAEYDLSESPETNQNYRVAVRIFGKRTAPTDDGNPPPSINWINSSLPNDYDPSPDPADMLRWEADIEPMLDGARNSRDEAAIALQFDAGLRGGELYDLRVGDLTSTDHGLAVRVDGKTGQRSVDLIPATPHINKWLTDHPGGDDDYLWTRLNSAERLSYNSFLDMFKRPASRAGLDKDVTPTALRKSNLAWLSRQGMNARHIERRQGRVHGSDAVARYAAIFDEDIGDEYAQMMGLEVAEDDDDASEFAPLECPQCGRETPSREDHCMWCHQKLRAGAEDKTAKQDRDLMAAMADRPELAEDLMDLKDLFDEMPGIRVRFDDEE